ncbi:response regulator [Erysipelothrix anatis]|uniref:response regulator n=1 Tax=Erysipelothrix anatis TaxID=2683713 RepID=UPI00135A0FDE|nr:response regulator [Erysipelothrix anatis]
MKILFVDDEQKILQYLKILVNWDDHGYEFLTASNGKEAIDILHDQNIDVMCLDITMPVMTGLDVLEWMSTRDFATRVVVMSAHDEFEIVKKAMLYGIHDYILKTDISRENIIKMIDGVSADNEKKRTNGEKDSLIAEYQIKEKYNETLAQFEHWLFQRSNTMPDLSVIDIPQQTPHYLPMIIAIENFDHVLERYAERDILEFDFVLKNIIQNTFLECTFLHVTEKSGAYAILLNLHNSYFFGDFNKTIQDKANQLHKSLNKFLDIQNSVYYIDEVVALDDVKQTFQNLEALHEMHRLKDDTTVHNISEFTFINDSKQAGSQQFLSDLHAAFDQENFGSIELVMDQYIEQIFQEKIILTYDQFALMIHNAFYVFIEKKKLEFPNFNLTAMPSLEMMKTTLRDFMLPMQDKELASSSNYVVNKAMMYIKNHYHEDIHLTVIAENVDVTPSYLSRLFPKIIGKSVVSYINEVRIIKAKELIENENLKFYEISEMVGFSSPIIFSTTFKKVTGETPGDYRKNYFANRKA